MFAMRSFNPNIASIVCRGVIVCPQYFFDGSFMQNPFSRIEQRETKKKAKIICLKNRLTFSVGFENLNIKRIKIQSVYPSIIS